MLVSPLVLLVWFVKFYWGKMVIKKTQSRDKWEIEHTSVRKTQACGLNVHVDDNMTTRKMNNIEVDCSPGNMTAVMDNKNQENQDTATFGNDNTKVDGSFAGKDHDTNQGSLSKKDVNVKSSGIGKLSNNSMAHGTAKDNQDLKLGGLAKQENNDDRKIVNGGFTATKHKTFDCKSKKVKIDEQKKLDNIFLKLKD